MKQRKVILDPEATSADLYQAGLNFIKILFGRQYKPRESEVELIVHFLCTNPNVSMEDLLRVSGSVKDREV